MMAITGPWRGRQTRSSRWKRLGGPGSLKAAGGALAGLLLALTTTPALAQQPQRPEQQAATRGWQGGTANEWSDQGPSPGCSNCSTQKAFERSRWAGRHYEYNRNLRENDRYCPNCGFGADRADTNNGTGTDYAGDHTGGGAGPK